MIDLREIRQERPRAREIPRPQAMVWITRNQFARRHLVDTHERHQRQQHEARARQARTRQAMRDFFRTAGRGKWQQPAGRVRLAEQAAGLLEDTER